MPAQPGLSAQERDEVTDAVISASRVLVAVAARSLAGLSDDVTLPQYRCLVVLASRGARGTAELAEALAVTPSTATRMCDRLVRKGLVHRDRPDHDRRTVRLAITAEGLRLVAEVTRRRRREVTKILSSMTSSERVELVAALRAFTDAAGEVPEHDWSLGWGQ